MPIYIGNTAIKVPYKKIYVGNDLKYQEQAQETYFNSSLAPVDWNSVTIPTKYKATNLYGEWIIEALNCSSSSRPVRYAFNSSMSDYWTGSTQSSDIYSWCKITPPILIKPRTIIVKHGCNNDGSAIQGHNPNTDSWEQLGVLPKTGSYPTSTTTLTLSGETYYDSYRVYANGNGSDTRVYDLKITEGYYK